MIDFNKLGPSELQRYRSNLMERYEEFKSQNLELDMTRGKPCPEQLDLSLGMLDCVRGQHFSTSGGVDCRNYGELDGISEAKGLFSQYLEVGTDEIIIGGNSSLNLMHDTIMRAMLFGVVDSEVPWGKLPQVKFLCPSPGYDRHFSICEYLQIEMVPIEMNEDGPDMDTVEKMVEHDESIKGIWCVPKYSNPSGVIYIDEVVERFARMNTKAKDFRIWAYRKAAWTVDELPESIAEIYQKRGKEGLQELPNIGTRLSGQIAQWLDEIR